MSIDKNIIKNQLGMAFSTARSILFKKIIYELAKESNRLYCYRCNELIEDIESFTVDHIVEWTHKNNARELYFDLSNIGFSHARCNTDARRCKSIVNNSLKYKGIEYNASGKRIKRYSAKISFDGKVKSLGMFLTPEEAARAYDLAALKYHGDRAITNEMLGLFNK